MRRIQPENLKIMISNLSEAAEDLCELEARLDYAVNDRTCLCGGWKVWTTEVCGGEGMTLLERLTGMVRWPRNRDPRIKGPQPRLITIEQAEAMERHRKEMEDVDEGV